MGWSSVTFCTRRSAFRGGPRLASARRTLTDLRASPPRTAALRYRGHRALTHGDTLPASVRHGAKGIGGIRVSQPAWAVAAVVTILAAVAGDVVAVVGSDGSHSQSSQTQIAADVRRGLATTSTTAVPASVPTSVPVSGPSSARATTTTLVTSTLPPPTAPPTSAAVPLGTVTYDQEALPGSGYASANCWHWNLRFINDSDTEVVQITFSPPSSYYWVQSPDYAVSEDRQADPPDPATIDVSIAPYQAEMVQFQTCTATPPPEGGEFAVDYPLAFSWRWVTGQEGSNCFYLGCETTRS